MKGMRSFLAEISATWLKRRAMRKTARSGIVAKPDKAHKSAPLMEPEKRRPTQPHRPTPPASRDIASNM